MFLLVHLQRTGLYEGLLTDDTNVRSLARVRALVTDDVALVMEPLAADPTRVRAFVRVRSAVGLQVEALEEGLTAIIANVVALLQVISLHVLLRIK